MRVLQKVQQNLLDTPGIDPGYWQVVQFTYQLYAPAPKIVREQFGSLSDQRINVRRYPLSGRAREIQKILEFLEKTWEN